MTTVAGGLRVRSLRKLHLQLEFIGLDYQFGNAIPFKLSKMDNRYFDYLRLIIWRVSSHLVQKV